MKKLTTTACDECVYLINVDACIYCTVSGKPVMLPNKAPAGTCECQGLLGYLREQVRINEIVIARLKMKISSFKHRLHEMQKE